MLKNAAVLLNCSLIVATFWMLLDEGMPNPNHDEFIVIMLVIITPIVTLFTFWRGAGEVIKDTQNLMALYLRRKVLEEQNRITELTARK